MTDHTDLISKLRFCARLHPQVGYPENGKLFAAAAAALEAAALEAAEAEKAAAVEAARREEREACARIARDHIPEGGRPLASRTTAMAIEAAILERNDG